MCKILAKGFQLLFILKIWTNTCKPQIGFTNLLMNVCVIPLAEEETPTKSRALQWFLCRPVWNTPLSQFDCLHELWSSYCHGSCPRWCCSALESPHRTCQQCYRQKDASRQVNLCIFTYIDLTTHHNCIIYNYISIDQLIHLNYIS